MIEGDAKTHGVAMNGGKKNNIRKNLRYESFICLAIICLSPIFLNALQLSRNIPESAVLEFNNIEKEVGRNGVTGEILKPYSEEATQKLLAMLKSTDNRTIQISCLGLLTAIVTQTEISAAAISETLRPAAKDFLVTHSPREPNIGSVLQAAHDLLWEMDLKTSTKKERLALLKQSLDGHGRRPGCCGNTKSVTSG